MTKWHPKLSAEAEPPSRVAAKCARCSWISGLRYVDGEFVCRDTVMCEARQRGEVDDTWEGYDADLER